MSSPASTTISSTAQSTIAESGDGAGEEPLVGCSYWWEALDHLEEQYPKSLERMLREGSLVSHLNLLALYASQAIRAYLGRDPREATSKQQKQAYEMYRELWAPPNPRYNPNSPEEMSPEGSRILAEFRERMEQLADNERMT